MEVDAKDAAGGGRAGGCESISSDVVGLPRGISSELVGQGNAGPSGLGALVRSLGVNGVIGGGGAVSDEEDPSFEGDGDEGGQQGVGRNKKTSPWQRMKWTDSMVKLLIGVVLYVGEDSSLDGTGEGNKRKSGILQKKGKWKSVSKVMMEKGCYVSPQQCEDKFNDLNKRYKRLSEILGKPMACTVVENPSTLDTMTHLLPKAKEDVKKILSSKHLFYKEMAFYHSGNKAALATDLEFQPSLQAVTLHGRELVESGRHLKDDMDEDEDVDDDFDIADADAVEEEGDAITDLSDPYGKRRKLSKKVEEMELGMAASSLHDYGKDMNGVELVNTGLVGVLQESSKASREHQLWIRNRTVQLEEQKVGLQAEAFNLEKQKFKWQKFSCKKDRELERMRLENERMKLENERIQLEIKQKELEMDSKRSEASMTSIALILDRLQARDQNDLGRGQCVQ